MEADARLFALQALHRILQQGCKADVATEGLTARDVRLVHQMVYGVLRHAFSLEADYSRFCRAKPAPWARLGLLLGSYQLRHMRVPDHAAVSETVAAVRSMDKSAASYVNAVLRRVAENDPPARLKPYQRAELPRWLYNSWRDAFGAETVQAMAEVLRRPPDLCLAVLTSREAWIDRAEARGIRAVRGEMSPYAVLVPRDVEIRDLPGYETGEFIVMDQAAQAVVMAVQDVAAGSVVLDLCAAPGGKSMLLASRFPEARILSVEFNAKRIPRMRENLRRTGLENVEIIQADAGCLPLAAASISRILLDAPCSASGVLRRHPDVKFLHQPADLKRLAAQQLRLGREAVKVLKPGGQLVYAVCSIHQAENEAVIESLMAEVPELGVESSCRLLPAVQHDGFFHAILRH